MLGDLGALLCELGIDRFAAGLGRQPGEIPQQMREDIIASGIQPALVQIAVDEVAALRTALDWARPGDFIALLVHVDEEGVRALLNS